MDPARDDSGLRSALSSLKPLLTKLGLEPPSRLEPYIPTSDCSSGDAGRLTAYEYLRESTKKVLLQHELKGGVEVAVLTFVDLVLDDEAPPMVLPCFMHALFLANDHPSHPNKGAWRVHDVLKMASFYMPLQQALVDLTKDRQTTDLLTLLSQLVQHALLQQTAMPDVLEAQGQEGGVESAVVLLLAYVYDAARLELIHNRRRCVQSPPVWLETLLQCVERWAGINEECSLLRERIPPSVLSADGWETVCKELVSTGGQLSIRENREETQSEAGDSDISDFTLKSCTSLHFNDKSQRKTNDVDQKLSGLNILEPEEEAFHESRQQRTAQYVFDMCDGHRRPPVCLELVEHSQRTAETSQLGSQYRATAVWHRADRDESGSVITEVSSASTENNSHVVTDSLAVDRGQQDPGVRDIARTLAYIGLSDVPDDGPGQITLRAYQKELLQDAKDGKNVIIVLPTGTGKTFIVIKYVQEYLNNCPGSHRRVVFLAPKVKLVEQQYRRFRCFFPHTTCLRTGKSRSSSAPLSELINMQVPPKIVPDISEFQHVEN